MDHELPLSECRALFLDIETTGLSYLKGDDIIELAVARTGPGMRIENCWSSLLLPIRDGKQVRIRPDAQAVHGIRECELLEQPLFKAIYPRLVEDIKAADFLVIHNARFDGGFLVAKMQALALPIPGKPVMCSLRVARELITEDGAKHGLKDLRARYEQSDEGAHRALEDTLCLYTCFFQMVHERMGETATLGQLLSLHGDLKSLSSFPPR